MKINLTNNKFILGQVLVFAVLAGLITLWAVPKYFNSTAVGSFTEMINLTKDPGDGAVVSAENNFAVKPVTILLVPGHDLFSKGGFFRELYEQEITLALAKDLNNLLQADGRFKVVTVRDFSTSDYTDEFATYFSSAEAQIEKFHLSTKEAMKKLLATGTVAEVEPVIQHNDAGKTTAFRLYGINKWANDNDVDLALHIHFNDHPREFHDSVGKYTGFALYVPEKQFTNASSSRQIAERLESVLSLVSATSTFPLEAETIIESQDLIATGANNSQTHSAVLVEYGYIYEPQYYLADKRTKSLPILAEATYKGLKKYFFSK